MCHGGGVVLNTREVCWAVVLHEFLDELHHLLPVGLGAGEDSHNRGLILALSGNVAKKHGAHFGQHVSPPVCAALIPEPHHVPLAGNVMRGHQHQL